jgi:hypothetical protein
MRLVGPEVDRVRDALVRRAKRARAKAADRRKKATGATPKRVAVSATRGTGRSRPSP